MGRCTKTIGERRLGRTIYKLGNSVEFSSKECKAKVSEREIKQKIQTDQGYTDNNAIQNLRDPKNYQKKT